MPISIDRISVVISECEGGFWCGHQGGAPTSKAKEEEKGAEALLHIVIDEGMIRFDRIEDGVCLPLTAVSRLSLFLTPLRGSRKWCIVLTWHSRDVRENIRLIASCFPQSHGLELNCIPRQTCSFFYFACRVLIWLLIYLDGRILLWKYGLLARDPCVAETSYPRLAEFLAHFGSYSAADFNDSDSYFVSRFN